MEKSSYYFLVAMIVLAPHLWDFVAIAIGVIFLLLSFLAGVFDINQHMLNAERDRS